MWQNRFDSCPLGLRCLATALAYVDLNPVRAGLVGEPVQYPWSSAAAHVTGDDAAGLIGEWEWSELELQGIGSSDWKAKSAMSRLQSCDGQRIRAYRLAAPSS